MRLASHRPTQTTASIRYGPSLARAGGRLAIASADPDMAIAAHIYRERSGELVHEAQLPLPGTGGSGGAGGPGGAAADFATVLRILSPPARTVAMDRDRAAVAVAGGGVHLYRNRNGRWGPPLASPLPGPPSEYGDFGAAMARMRRLRAAISHVDSAERFKGLGVDVFIGEGRFTGRDTVRVGDTTLRFARAAVCTGARATALPIPGLAETGFLTNETVFSLTALPRRLAVIGAGPIGCELAQAFARFGSEVTVFELTPHILPREDPDAAAVVQARMERDGVRFAFDTAIDRVEPVAADDPDGGGKRVRYTTAGEAREATVDEILVGVGRAPNVEGLGLEEAGVSYDRSGVQVDACLRTGNPRIYAAGDICSPFKFTHAADAMAQIVIQNALFPHPFGLGMASTESLNIPWCTYTEPEIAHVGMYEADARKKGIEIETFTQPLADVDRAVLDGEDAGFARVHVRKGTDRILGATIVAADAGNLITEVTVAMKAGTGLGTIGAAIHPYPTQAEAWRKAANQMRKARFSDRQRAILSRLFAWRR